MYIYYVYAYLREDGSPYYIGKGKENRAYSKQHNINKPTENDRIVFWHENLSEEQAFELEKQYIMFYGRKDIGTGILRNKTDGGEGASNPSLESRLKRVQSRYLSDGFFRSKEAEQKRKETLKTNYPNGYKHTEEINKKAVQKRREKDNYIHMKKENIKRIKNGTHNFLLEWTCPHCNSSGKNQINYIRWHGDNCKKKKGG